jgi:hypothetical protein
MELPVSILRKKETYLQITLSIDDKDREKAHAIYSKV